MKPSLKIWYCHITLQPNQLTIQPFLLGELLTNLYVGLCRFHRGEKLSAMRFIQIYALDRLITLLDMEPCSGSQPCLKTIFAPTEEWKLRHPQQQRQILLDCAQGALNCTESAEVMLNFVIQTYLENTTDYQSIIKEIRNLLKKS